MYMESLIVESLMEPLMVAPRTASSPDMMSIEPETASSPDRMSMEP